MLIVGIIVLVVSILVERVTTIRSARLVNQGGGDWQSRDGLTVLLPLPP